MTRLIFASLFSLFAGMVSAIAGERVVVVELYTSQGCSSCPPADRLLGELAQRDDVIPLALHVDYWDYLGWKDDFANPMHTERQRGYARAAGQRTIYTPQMIVGGVDHVVGYKPMKLAKVIETHADLAERAPINLARKGDLVEIRIPATPGLGAVEVHLVRYSPAQTVKVRRGENAGRTLDYHNVVGQFDRIAGWDGAAPFATQVEAKGDAPVVVLLQREGYGPIFSAARLR